MATDKKITNILEKIINKISLCKIKFTSMSFLFVTKDENPCRDLACEYKNNKLIPHKNKRILLL